MSLLADPLAAAWRHIALNVRVYFKECMFFESYLRFLGLGATISNLGLK